MHLKIYLEKVCPRMNENSTGLGMNFFPNRITENQGNVNIFSALHIVQAQNGMGRINGF